ERVRVVAAGLVVVVAFAWGVGGDTFGPFRATQTTQTELHGGGQHPLLHVLHSPCQRRSTVATVQPVVLHLTRRIDQSLVRLLPLSLQRGVSAQVDDLLRTGDLECHFMLPRLSSWFPRLSDPSPRPVG